MFTRRTRILLLSAGCLMFLVQDVNSAIDSGDVPAESRLRHKLMMDYDKSTRPGEYSADKTTTTVFLDPYLLHVEACDREMTVTLGGWVVMSWHDPRLTWEPAKYGNITRLRVDSRHIWTLDLVPFYMVPSININWMSNTLALVMNNGTVLYVPPFQTKASCTFNRTTTGPEEHGWNVYMMCPETLGSWTYSEELVDLRVPQSGVLNTMYYRPSGRWVLHNTSAKKVSRTYAGLPELYVSDEIMISLKYKHKFMQT